MFGKLKEKLKSWFASSKEKVEETAEKKEIKVEETPKTKKEPKRKKEIKEKKGEKEIKPEKEEKIIEELPEIKPEEQGTAIKIETEIEEGIPQEIIDKELEEVKEAKEEAKEIKEKLKETKEEYEKPKSFFSKLFKRKEKVKEPEKEVEKPKEKGKLKPKETIGVLGKEAKESFFTKIKSTFSYKISEDNFNEIFDDLEMLLLENNVALEVVEDIKKILSKKLIGKEIAKDDLEDEIRKELKNTLNEVLIEPDNPLEIIKISKRPFVILFFGINGTGKTTSIAKIAYFLKKSGFSVVVAAADTFRAASIEQLTEHANRLKIPIIKQDYNADPAAVGFDAIKYAEKHKIDVVLIDTAGRMHTKTNLLAEMEKICRVTKPQLKIFVAESIAGNDATEQAKAFNEIVAIDGSILTKADIDEKGGTIISVSHATNKPIFYLGTGQNYEDLQLFNKQKFIDSLGI